MPEFESQNNITECNLFFFQRQNSKQNCSKYFKADATKKAEIKHTFLHEQATWNDFSVLSKKNKRDYMMLTEDVGG